MKYQAIIPAAPGWEIYDCLDGTFEGSEIADTVHRWPVVAWAIGEDGVAYAVTPKDEYITNPALVREGQDPDEGEDPQPQCVQVAFDAVARRKCQKWFGEQHDAILREVREKSAA